MSVQTRERSLIEAGNEVMREQLESSRTAQIYADALTEPPHVRPRPATSHDWTALWRLTPYMRPYLGRFIAMFVMAGVMILANIAIPLVTRSVIDGPIADGDRRGVIMLGLLALALGVLEAFLQFWRRWIVARATLGVETGARLELYAKLQRLPMDFHRRWESGQLLSRIMSDLGIVRRFLGFGFLFLVMNLTQVVIVTILLISMYPPLGVIVAISVVPVAALCRNMQRKYMLISRRIQDENGDVTSSIEESVQGLRVIKAFGRGGHVYGTFDHRATTLFGSWMDRVRLTSVFWTFLEVIPNLTLVVVMAVGAFAAASGAVTMGTLVAFITLLLSLIWPVASMGFLLSMVQEAMTAADRIVEVFDAEETIVDGTQILDNPRGHLSFRDAAYTFPDADAPVLHDLNLEVSPGETVAIVGGTGTGKTTLTALVPRLIDVSAGSVAIDGVDVRDLRLDDLRRHVATAFEEPTLFSMSVRENLTLGRPDATDGEIREALDIAQAHFVDDLPWGLDTRIGEQGMSLSGGQRQRLALARAVITKPTVLVLDDTLSALDIHTEALVEEALSNVLTGVTALIVAHRASTVLLADRVAMVEGGTIAHVGCHEDLLATVPAYRELLSAEFHLQREYDHLEGERHE